jgi:hypothetical protein
MLVEFCSSRAEADSACQRTIIPIQSLLIQSANGKESQRLQSNRLAVRAPAGMLHRPKRRTVGSLTHREVARRTDCDSLEPLLESTAFILFLRSTV